MKKKLCILIAVILVAAAGFTGCAGKLDGSQAVAVLDETNIPLAEVNLMLRYQQAQMETYYGGILGGSIFQQDLTGSGVNYGETLKAELMNTFEEMYVLEAEAPNYGVELSEEEKTAISEAAADFVNANADRNVKAALTLSQEAAEHVLTLATIQVKMRDALTADVDREVSDEEAAQKRVSYLYASKAGTEQDEEGNTIDLTEEELAQVKAKAEEVLAEAKAGTDFSEAAEAKELSVSSVTYGDADETTALPEEVREQADALAEGEYSGVIDTEYAYYVVRMDSLFDEDATETKKESIVQSRISDMYTEKCEELKEQHQFELKTDVLEKLTFDQTVTLKMEEQQ